MRMNISHPVQKPLHLIAGCSDDIPVAVAASGDTEGRSQIEIFSALNIPDMISLRAFPDDRPGPILCKEGNIARLEFFQEGNDC